MPLAISFLAHAVIPFNFTVDRTKTKANTLQQDGNPGQSLPQNLHT